MKKIILILIALAVLVYIIYPKLFVKMSDDGRCTYFYKCFGIEKQSDAAPSGTMTAVCYGIPYSYQQVCIGLN
jgi:uncharacterized protein YxeA